MFPNLIRASPVLLMHYECIFHLSIMADSSLVPSLSHHPVFLSCAVFLHTASRHELDSGIAWDETKFVLDLACLGALINAFSIKKKYWTFDCLLFCKFTAASFPGLPQLQFLRLQFVMACSTASHHKLRAGNKASIKCNIVCVINPSPTLWVGAPREGWNNYVWSLLPCGCSQLELYDAETMKKEALPDLRICNFLQSEVWRVDQWRVD